MDATVQLTQWRLFLSELGFYVVHRTGTKNQAVNAFPRLSTTRKDSTPTDDPLLAMLIVFRRRENDKVCTKTARVIEHCYDEGFIFIP